MTTIVDSIPERNFRIITEFKLDEIGRLPLSQVVYRFTQEQADSIARKILEEKEFFKLVEIGGGYYTLKVDCIVLTQAEYYKLMVDQFKIGLHHAQGYRSEVIK